MAGLPLLHASAIELSKNRGAAIKSANPTEDPAAREMSEQVGHPARALAGMCGRSRGGRQGPLIRLVYRAIQLRHLEASDATYGLDLHVSYLSLLSCLVLHPPCDAVTTKEHHG